MALKDGHAGPSVVLLFSCMVVAMATLLWLNVRTLSYNSGGCRHNRQLPEGNQPPAWPSPSLPSTWTFRGVSASTRAEADSLLTPYCNASFVKKHPLSDADYQRSFVPASNACSMPPGLLPRLTAGTAPLKITVVGGSMTAGAACVDDDRLHQQCAWPARMRDRLQGMFPAANISLHNMAKHSFSYTSWLESGMLQGLVDTDVLVVDLQINSQVYKFDAFYQMQEADEFLFGVLAAARRRQPAPGVLFVESFLTCGNFSALCDAHCGDRSRQGSLTTSIEGYNTTHFWCNRYYTMADLERPVVAHYGLPVASYRAAVWPSFANPRPTLPCFSNGYSHMDPIGHHMFGDVVSYGLVRSLMDAERNAATYEAECTPARQPSKFHTQMPSMRYCLPPTSSAGSSVGASNISDVGLAPLGQAGGGAPPPRGQAVFMSVAQAEGFQPLRAGSWLWRADRPNKPGWIFDPAHSDARLSATAGSSSRLPTSGAISATSTSGSSEADTIWFRVAFSSHPQLQLTYLTSYERIGAVELTIHSVTVGSGPGFDNSTALAGYVLDAVIKERYSIPRTTILVHPSTVQQGARKGRNTMRLPSSVAQGEYVIALRPLARRVGLPVQKFKLLGVASC